MTVKKLNRRRNGTALVITIDTECDKGVAWKTLRPLSFHSVTRGIPTVLSPLFDRYGIRPTYLVSPEVLRDTESVKVLGNLQNTELGAHLHGEFIGPEEDPNAEATSRVQASYRPEIEYQKLANLTSMFKQLFGRSPQSFRGGRFSLSNQSLGFLAQLGYKVDTTVTPFRTNLYDEGPTANYWGASLHPYRPSQADPRRQGDLPLLEVPVSILSPSFRRWPGWLLRLLTDKSASRMARLRWLGLSPEKYWVRPLRGSTSDLMRWADFIIDHWEGNRPAVINVMFHSNECWVGTSPYTLEEEGLRVFVRDLEALLEHIVVRRGAKPVMLAELAIQYGIN